MGRTLRPEPRASAHFDFLYGCFGMSRWKIPYFVTTVTLRDAALDLHLTSEIPSSEGIRWSLDELYQRDIDWNRVDFRIAPYLRDVDNPQFFNAITIALLPYDPSRRTTVDRFSADVAWKAPRLANEGAGADSYAKTLEVGPIKFGFWDSWENVRDPEFCSGQMRWNTDQVFGVAIDGQHRLAAIKTLVRSGGRSVEELEQTRIPVILLVFDERVGFESPEPSSTVGLLRRLFIDLNKHAQTVSRGRQILLDDRDPQSLCVRALLQPELSANIEALTENPPRLPLSLVDWHSEQARFDAGPYITTVLGLDWLVGKVLETKPIKDYTDYGALAKQVKKLENRLGIDLKSARERLKELEDFQQRPFSYSDGELKLIASAFADVWNNPIVAILSQFSPYAELISKRKSDDSFQLEFQEWFRLYEAKKQDSHGGKATTEYDEFVLRLESRSDNPIGAGQFEKIVKALDKAKRDNLAFNVAFQRALFLAFLEYAKLSTADIEELDYIEDEYEFPDFGDLEFSEEDESYYGDSAEQEFQSSEAMTMQSVLKEQYSARAFEFVGYLNRIVDRFPDFLVLDGECVWEDGSTDEFWAGTLLRKPENTIDFTQSASVRAEDLIFLAVAMVLYDERTEPEERSDFDGFWIACTEQPELAITRSIGRGIARYCKGPTSAAGRILRAKGLEYDEELAYAEARVRLQYLWESLEL